MSNDSWRHDHACRVSATNGRGYEGDVSLYRVEVDLASKPLEVTFS